MIAPRYVPAICLLLALALIPSIIHSYSGTTTTDGRVTAAIPTGLDGATSIPGGRRANWFKRRFDSDDAIQREYVDGQGNRLTLTVIRSYDLKRLYHHPELAVAYDTSFAGEEVHRPTERPGMPVHVLKTAPNVDAAAMYVLHYDTRFIADPIAFQIRTAGELLFSRRKPMTLFFVLDGNARGGVNVDDSPAATLLFAAVDAFLSQGRTD